MYSGSVHAVGSGAGSLLNLIAIAKPEPNRNADGYIDQYAHADDQLNADRYGDQHRNAEPDANLD